MKVLLPILCLAGLCAALPSQDILTYQAENHARQEVGVPGEKVRGYYTWQNGDRSYRVDYTADEKGFLSDLQEVKVDHQPAAPVAEVQDAVVQVAAEDSKPAEAAVPADFVAPAESAVPADSVVPADSAVPAIFVVPAEETAQLVPQFEDQLVGEEEKEDEIDAALAEKVLNDFSDTLSNDELDGVVVDASQFIESRQKKRPIDVEESVIEEAVEEYYKIVPSETLPKSEVRKIVQETIAEILENSYFSEV